jgi:hypothetical protein
MTGGSTAAPSKVRRRMRQALRALLACGAGFAVSLIAACGGGGGLLSSGQASSLQSTLQQLSADYQSGQCGAVRSGSQGLTNAVGAVQSVNPGLQSDLNKLASNVAQLAQSQCRQSSTASSTPTTSSSTSSSTTTPTSSTSSSSTSTSTSSTSTSTSSSTSGTSTSTSGTTSTGPSGGTGVGGSNGP